MTPAPEPMRVLLEADDRGRVPLGRFGFRSMHLVAEPTDDGGVVLHPVHVTPEEAAQLGDPEAARMVGEASARSSTRRVETFEYRSAGSES